MTPSSPIEGRCGSFRILDDLYLCRPSIAQWFTHEKNVPQAQELPFANRPLCLQCRSESNREEWQQHLQLLSKHPFIAMGNEDAIAQLRSSTATYKVLTIPPGSMPSLEAMDGVDAMELQLFEEDPSTGFRRPKLPIDILQWDQIEKKHQAISMLARGKPIGIRIMKSTAEDDCKLALQFDFVTLVGSSPMSASDGIGIPDEMVLASFRRAIKTSGKSSFPIYLESTIRNEMDLLKLQALGATAIFEHGYQTASDTAHESTRKDDLNMGLLGDLGSILPRVSPSASNRRLETISRLLKKYHSALQSLSPYHGIHGLSERLVTTNRQLAQQLDIGSVELGTCDT